VADDIGALRLRRQPRAWPGDAHTKARERHIKAPLGARHWRGLWFDLGSMRLTSIVQTKCGVTMLTTVILGLLALLLLLVAEGPTSTTDDQSRTGHMSAFEDSRPSRSGGWGDEHSHDGGWGDQNTGSSGWDL
jgi:hypothetical protein